MENRFIRAEEVADELGVSKPYLDEHHLHREHALPEGIL